MTPRSIGRLAALMLTLAAPIVSTPAHAQDAVLYEVSENVSLKSEGSGVSFQSSSATLVGALRAGTPLCPASAPGGACTLSVNAVGKAGDDNGIGPVTGNIVVLVQDWNKVDAPEVIAARATLTGTLDLSPAALKGTPLGYITGQYEVKDTKTVLGLVVPKHKGSFKGVFRLPFLYNNQASYLTPAGVVPIGNDELTLGMPSVRLEITIID